MNVFKKIRNSRMELNEVYFWTDTIKDWKHLLKQDKYKEIILASLRDLVLRKKIIVYGFVIMPNHIHIIWELLEKVGKEMPHASFNKATAHIITKDLKQNHEAVLKFFEVSDKERSYRIWQRDPLAIHLDSKSKMEQKLDYIHRNPLHERWNLSKREEEYHYSSASFYQNGIDKFGFLTHYIDRY